MDFFIFIFFNTSGSHIICEAGACTPNIFQFITWVMGESDGTSWALVSSINKCRFVLWRNPLTAAGRII